MNSRTYYYARVSSKEQNLDRQIAAFKALGADERDIITDKDSGKDLDRKGYQALKNASNLSLDQLLGYQYNIGGVNLHDNSAQLEFLEDFYNYVEKNKSDNYSTPYSEWIKEA